MGELHRTIIHLLCVVCTYHNNAVEFSGTVAMAISPSSGASAWQSIMYVMWTSIMRQSKNGMHLTTLINMCLNFLTISVTFLPTQVAVPVQLPKREHNFCWWVLLYAKTNLTKQPSIFQTGVFCTYIALFHSFPVSGHMLHERALSKVMYHAAHCLSAIFTIFCIY